MFYAIRRMIKLLMGLCVLAVLFWVYQQRAIFEPAFVWYDVYENGGITNTTALPTVSGRATRVTDPHTFQIRQRKGDFLTVRLTGLQEEPVPTTPQEFQLQKPKRDALAALVLSNFVHVDVTYSNKNSILGVAYANGTNVNTALVAHGDGRLKPEYIKLLPRQTQYAFFRAHRVAAKAAKEKKTID
jgi:endonuclease YncB( thermonuclease family)